MTSHLRAAKQFVQVICTVGGLLAAGVVAAQAPPAAPDGGQPLVAVRIVDESGRVVEENPPAAALKAGERFDSYLVRESILAIYRTGRFADVRAEITAAPGGVRLDFVVRHNLFFNQLRVEGLRSEALENRALAAMQLGLGETYTAARVEAALARLRETLRDAGYYEARATLELQPHAATRQMDVLLRVIPGPAARIGAVTLVNHTAFPDKQILSQSRLKPGQRLAPRRLERAADRVRRFLSGRGHLSSRALLRRGAYDAAAHTVPLELEATAGVRVRVEVTGAKVPERSLRQLVPVFQEGTVDEDLLQEGRRNLRSWFEREGYFDAVVSVAGREDAQEGLRVITYAVDRGRQRRLAGVAFSGNRYFSTALLHERIRLLPARTFDRGRFSQRLLAEDAAGIRELYLANGFLSASVTPALEERYAGREQDIFVRFLVVEGQQTRVAELSIVGNQALDVETLFNAANSTPGQPFSEFNVAGDRDNILATYFNEGFPAARFEWEQRPAAQPGRVRLTYRLVEGPQVRVRDVLLSGYQFTRQHVIARELLLDPPEPLRQRNVVETQRRLYNLGVFRRVQLAPQNPAGTEPEKTMVVLVEEAKRTTVAYGGGIEFQRFGDRNDPVARGFRASPRGLLEVSRSNFAGRAHTVSLKARASSLQGRALASYAAPNFLGHRQWNLLVTGLADKSVDVNTFTSQRYEAGWQLEHRISDSTSFLYRYSFRRVLVDPDSLRIDPQQIPLFSQPTRISGFGLSWIRDRRDDPAEARSGTFNTFDLSLAQKTLGSSATFFRFFTQNSTFHPLPRRLVFARSLRFGFQQPFHDTLADEIPLPERFFSGGGNTLRGFGLNQAGPRDPVTGFPVGGLALLVLNNELRFPLRLPRLGEQVGGAVFYDAGNAFSRLSQMTFRVTPRSPTELNYFSHTIGIGFRYATPIGPVRLDLGYQLNAAQFAVDDGMGSQRFLRVPRFQFFFNIGSIF